MSYSVEDLGKIFGVSVNQKWGEAYELFQELEAAGRRDFARGGTRTSGQVYSEMMDAASEAALLDDIDYEESVEEVTNAVIYSANSEVSRREFRRCFKEVINDKKDWEYFANQSI